MTVISLSMLWIDARSVSVASTAEVVVLATTVLWQARQWERRNTAAALYHLQQGGTCKYRVSGNKLVLSAGQPGKLSVLTLSIRVLKTQSKQSGSKRMHVSIQVDRQVSKIRATLHSMSLSQYSSNRAWHDRQMVLSAI